MQIIIYLVLLLIGCKTLSSGKEKSEIASVDNRLLPKDRSQPETLPLAYTQEIEDTLADIKAFSEDYGASSPDPAQRQFLADAATLTHDKMQAFVESDLFDAFHEELSGSAVSQPILQQGKTDKDAKQEDKKQEDKIDITYTAMIMLGPGLLNIGVNIINFKNGTGFRADESGWNRFNFVTNAGFNLTVALTGALLLLQGDDASETLISTASVLIFVDALLTMKEGSGYFREAWLLAKKQKHPVAFLAAMEWLIPKFSEGKQKFLLNWLSGLNDEEATNLAKQIVQRKDNELSISKKAADIESSKMDTGKVSKLGEIRNSIQDFLAKRLGGDTPSVSRSANKTTVQSPPELSELERKFSDKMNARGAGIMGIVTAVVFSFGTLEVYHSYQGLKLSDADHEKKKKYIKRIAQHFRELYRLKYLPSNS